MSGFCFSATRMEKALDLGARRVGGNHWHGEAVYPVKRGYDRVRLETEGRPEQHPFHDGARSRVREQELSHHHSPTATFKAAALTLDTAIWVRWRITAVSACKRSGDDGIP